MVSSLYDFCSFPLFSSLEAYTTLISGSSTESPGANGTPCEENKRTKRSFQSKAFTVEISFAAKIPLQSIALSLEGIESCANSQDALRVLNIVLRQRVANRYPYILLT